MFTLLTIFLQYIHCYDSTSFFCFVLLTCYVQVMSFCSRLCSNYEMHSLLQIHKSGRVTPVFFVYSSGPSRGPGRGVRAVSASWSWDATKATKSWCKIAVRWEREKVAKDARGENWYRADSCELCELGLVPHGVSQLLVVDGS